MRKFGEISWVDHVDEFIEERGLGPDAVEDLDRERFGQLIADHAGNIKGTLMSQDTIAGLGNIYVDEILFQSGIHPETKTTNLGSEEIGRIFDALHEVVERAIDARADPDGLPDDRLIPHRQPGAQCPRDGGTIEKTELLSRPTFVCNQHQKRVE